jgi:hypothetical protein
MKFANRKTTIILTLVVLTTELLAQDSLKIIRVIDNLTKRPVKDALIYVNDSIQSKTNYLGYSQTNGLIGDTLLISCIDYNEKFIIIPPEPKFQVGIEKKEDKLGFTGGVRAFYEHWSANLKYPGKARSKQIQSVIYVEFKVDSLGNSSLTRIHNDVTGLFENEVSRVFKSIAGKWDIEYSNRTFLLPIKFRMASLNPPNDIQLKNMTPDRKLSEIVVTVL